MMKRIFLKITMYFKKMQEKNFENVVNSYTDSEECFDSIVEIDGKYIMNLGNGITIQLNRKAVNLSRAVHKHVYSNLDRIGGVFLQPTTLPYVTVKPGGCDDESCKWCALYMHYSPLIPKTEVNNPNTYLCINDKTD